MTSRCSTSIPGDSCASSVQRYRMRAEPRLGGAGLGFQRPLRLQPRRWREPRLARGHRLRGADAHGWPRRSPASSTGIEGLSPGISALVNQSSLSAGSTGSSAGAASTTSASSRRWSGVRVKLFVPKPSCQGSPYEDEEPSARRRARTDDQPYVVAFICQGLALLGSERGCSTWAPAPATRPPCSPSTPPRCTRSNGSRCFHQDTHERAAAAGYETIDVPRRRRHRSGRYAP